MATGSSKTSRKNALSCAECRRSKLKCDRVFPCQSCIKRGCASLCPDGELGASKGNKVLSTRVQQLNDQVKALSSRIRELEKELASTSLSPPSNDDSAPDMRNVLSTPNPDEFETRREAIVGSLAMDDSGRARFYGETACPHNLYYLLSPKQAPDPPPTTVPFEDQLPEGTVELAKSFPFGTQPVSQASFEYAHLLPTYDDVLHLLDLYDKYFAYAFDPIPRVDLMKTVIDIVYAIPTMPMPQVIHSHRMAGFLTILAIGCVYDTDPTVQAKAALYETLAKAAFATDPLFGASTVSSVATMYLLFMYSHLADKTRKGNDYRWILLGICARVSHSIGLHRSSGNWKLDDEEADRRRRTFWELFFWESHMSILLGRPPSLSIRNVDTKFPQDIDATIAPDGTKQCSFHSWKFRYTASIIPNLNDVLLSGRVPDYPVVLLLDRKMRQFPVPPHLQAPGFNDRDPSSSIGPWPEDANLAMQQYMVLCMREWNFLQLHRPFCMWAFRDNSVRPLATKYAPSVLATYRSAYRCVTWLKSLFEAHYESASRFWFFEAAALSSIVVLVALVAESPNFSLGRSALEHLDLNVSLFSRFQTTRTHPLYKESVERLQKRAHAVMNSPRSADVVPMEHLETTFAEVDELQILGGCTQLITVARLERESAASQGPSASPNVPSSLQRTIDPAAVTQPHEAQSSDIAQDVASIPNSFWTTHGADLSSFPQDPVASDLMRADPFASDIDMMFGDGGTRHQWLSAEDLYEGLWKELGDPV